MRQNGKPSVPDYPPLRSPLLYGSRRPFSKQKRLELLTIGLRLPDHPDLATREEASLDLELFRFALWQPGPYAIGDFPHFALRVAIGSAWRPYLPGPILEEGDQVIEVHLRRYRLRAYTRPTPGPLQLSPSLDDSWTIE